MATDIFDYNRTYTNSASDTNYYGVHLTTTKACTLKEVTKDSSCSATKCYLINDSSTILDTQAFSTDTATFNYNLENSTGYYIVVGNDGASYNRRYVNQDPDESGTNFNVDDRGQYTYATSTAARLDTYSEDIDTITTEYVSEVTVTPDTLTLSTTDPEPTIKVKIIDSLSLSGILTIGEPNIDIYIPPNYVTVGTGTKGTRFLTTDWPIEEGLIAGTTKQTGNISNLVPLNSLVPKRRKIGL